MNFEKFFDGDIYIEERNQTETAPLHTHSFFELVYVEKGTAESILGGKVIKLKPGDLFVIDIGAEHSYGARSSDFKIINFIFYPECVGETFKNIKSFNEILRRFFITVTFRVPGKNMSNTVFTATSTLRNILYEILDEYREKNFGFADIMKYKLRIFMIELVRSIGESRPVGEFLYEIFSYIEKGMSLKEIAEKTHYSSAYISQFFKRETGENFKDYIQKKKIEKSLPYLKERNISVDTVSEKAGYMDVKFYRTLFKKYMGMTPNQYRRMFENDVRR